MTFSNTITHQTKTLVDNTNTLWNMEYSQHDNSVTIVSDRATHGGYAVLNQYSLDNALGHDIPSAIVSSAEDMLVQDNDSLLRLMTTSVVAADIAESYDDNKFYA